MPCPDLAVHTGADPLPLLCSAKPYLFILSHSLIVIQAVPSQALPPWGMLGCTEKDVLCSLLNTRTLIWLGESEEVLRGGWSCFGRAQKFS